jgi:hypothetical protein
VVADGDANCSEACNEGAMGTCTSPEPTMTACLNGACNGAGVCELDDGQVCTLDSQCINLCLSLVCDCPATLAVQDDGSGASGGVPIPDLVISEINPGDYIELFNTTGTPIMLGNGSFQFCSPFTYQALSTLAPSVVVPAGGFATVPWPGTFTDVDAGGEILLYSVANFGVDTNILDFTCWGVNPHMSRKTQAENINKWSGACPAALGNGALHRNVSTQGNAAADYDVTGAPTGANCTP